MTQRIRGVLAPVLDAYGVGFRVMHGFGGATTVHEIAQDNDGRDLIAIYVGDYDPSGMHMSEVDLPARIGRYGGCIIVWRVAISYDDTWGAEGDIPSFPASDKRGDPRHTWFTKHYGDECWELDALSPKILRERVDERIRSFLDLDAWTRAEEIESAQRETTQQYVAGLQGISMPAKKYQGDAAP